MWTLPVDVLTTHNDSHASYHYSMGLTCMEAKRLPVTQFYEKKGIGLDNSNVRILDVVHTGFKLEFFLPQLPNARMLPYRLPAETRVQAQLPEAN